MTVSIKTKTTPPKELKPTKAPDLSVVAKVIKGDTYMVMNDSAKELEDEFVNLYYVQGGTGSNLAVMPPYPPKTLKQLVKQNNILNQCVQAMEVNIDGTGHEFVKMDDTVEIDEDELAQARAFFTEPYPGKSFITQRRALRQDLESMGYAYLEVLRTMDGSIVGTRYIEGQTIRMVRLGEPMDMKYTVSRGGQNVDLTIKERPRRYMQTFNGMNCQYFKEFGVPLDLDKYTGAWAEAGKSLPAERRASEVLAFGVDKDHGGPYSVPRWINQLPSVLGSRKAEEANLEFFDSGGMPPAIIFIQGGQMVGDASNQLRTYLSSANRKKGRAVVVELASNSGSIDSSGSVSARVERFGAQSGDAMYDKYDTKAEEHVRVGFRLPQLFIGRAQDLNYATAVIAYQVAEAQVFQPERTEFDEIINKTLMKGLGYKTIRFRSLPITMKSVDELLKGLPLVTEFVDKKDVVVAVNSALGTDLKYKEPPKEPPTDEGADPGAGTEEPPQEPHKAAPDTAPSKPQVKKSEVPTIELLKLVRRMAEIESLVDPLLDLSDSEKETVLKSVAMLDPETKQLFNQLLASYCAPAHDHSH
jgi:PBSX family phage portal protein